MKKTFLNFIVSLIFAQPILAQTYNGPESVEFDYAHNRYLVSNTGSSRIIARAADGTLTNFTSPLSSAPYGIEIVADTLYACTGGNLTGISLSTGAVLFTINIGGSFLNGITHDPLGNLYITDFSSTPKKIYRCNTATRQFNVYVNNTLTTPNGIIYDSYDGINPRLVFGNWGSNALIKSVSMIDSSIATICTTAVSNIDGFCKGKNGMFYLSSYSNNKIVRYDSTFTTATTLVSTGLSAPADICYNFNSDTLAVPNSGGSSVNFYYQAVTTHLNDISFENNLVIYPNPTLNEINLQLNHLKSGNLMIQLIDLNGKICYKKSIKTVLGKQTYQLSLKDKTLANGTYLMQLFEDDTLIASQKLVIGLE